jgi:SAM-dependent methyltransferase
MGENRAQAEYWRSAPGQKWIQFEDELDIVFEAVNEALVARAQPNSSERVVDIGCGTGATTRAFSKCLGPEGSVTAIDISEPLLARARARAAETAAHTTYLLNDAQTDTMEGDPFDLATSRFGVMFFADPVAAFANIRSWLHPDGRLVVAGWAAIDGNPWFEVPRDAAMAQLGPPDPSDPNGPGPLGFQNIGHVSDVLMGAGFADINTECAEVTLRHPGPIERVAALAVNIGPAARILKKYGGDSKDIEAIAASVLSDFQKFKTSEGVRIPARLNFFSARNLSSDA